MAQKVNSTNLRLNKRLNWKITSCAHNFNDYSNVVYNANRIINTNTNIMRKLNAGLNNVATFKNSKNFEVNYDVLDQRFFIHFTKLICSSKRTIQNFYNFKNNSIETLRPLLRQLMLGRNNILFSVSKTEVQKKLDFYNGLKRPFLFFFPKLFSEFAKAQIMESKIINLKKNNFSRNLQRSLVSFVNYFLLEFYYDILGIKIICSGRWQKTGTGRKQKLYLKFGRIQNSNIANKILYHNVNQKTKYGMCSIKIWIAHKTVY